MKRIISFITAFIMSASLAACGKYTTDNKKKDISDEVSSAEVSEKETTEAETKTEAKAENGKLTRGINLSDADVRQVVKVGLNGVFSEDTYISDVYNINILHSGVVGLFGCPVEINSDEFEEAVIVFEYNPDDMNNVPAKSLIMLHYNEEQDCYDEVSSKLSEEKHTVSAKITEPGAYMLTDAYEWYRTWGDEASEFAHDVMYTDRDFNFSMIIPKEIQIQHVSAMLEDDEEGKCQTLLECYKNDNIQIGIEYLERPTYASAEEFINIIADTLECERGKITAQDGTIGYYFYIDFGSDTGRRNLSMNCVFPIDNTHYINIWYGFTDEKYHETAVKSLESFKWNNISEIELPTETPTETETENSVSELEKAVTASDIILKLPDGIVAEAVDEEWQHNTAASEYRTDLFKFDAANYSEYVYGISATLFDDNYSIYTRADGMENLASDTNGLSFIKRDSVTLPNGCDGEIYSISHDVKVETDLYKAENGLYYIYGWFETPDSSQLFNITILLDKDAPQEIFDELYNFVMNVDMK